MIIDSTETTLTLTRPSKLRLSIAAVLVAAGAWQLGDWLYTAAAWLLS